MGYFLWGVVTQSTYLVFGLGLQFCEATNDADPEA